MTRVEVKPELLRWARERAGFDARRRSRTAFRSFRHGSEARRIRRSSNSSSFAKATHTPVGYLFLAEPPVERVPIPDFRTIGSRARRDARARTCSTRSTSASNARSGIATSRGPRGRNRSRSSAPLDLSEDVETTAASIRSALGFDVEERRQMPTWTDALRRFIEQADELGVLVMVSGVVGSNNRRKLDPEEFRGFALSDDLAPLVFINGADTKAAQMFTLAHELAHVWLGQSALSDVGPVSVASHTRSSVWCNRVAAELLVPLAALRDEYQRSSRVARRSRPPGAALQGQHAGHPAADPRRRRAHAGASSGEAYEAELDRLRAIPKRERRRLLPDARRAREQAVRPRPRGQHLGGPIVLHGGVPAARIQEDGDVPRARAQPRGGRLMAYLLDANVFIRAKNLHYGLDFCPAFWDWLIANNAASAVFSIEKVGDEVQAVADELSEWAEARGAGFFLRPDAAVFPRWRRSAPGPAGSVTNLPP